ncbi:MAG: hypothetical protein GWN62_18725 [Aliifodinibius sp.]|nr:hypothetical protein [Fodinibius sp.]
MGIPGKNIYRIWIILFLFSPQIVLLAESATEINLIYTGNINCTLDDCHCEGEVVGGFTRILTVLNQLNSQYPEMILVDGGDFLSSYSIPKANRLMLSLLSEAPYDALNLGDQELVEGAGFILDFSNDKQVKLPIISTNLQWQLSDEPLTSQYKLVRRNAVSIAIIGIVEPTAFSFISSNQLTVSSPAKTLKEIQERIKTHSDLQILLYHGAWPNALNFPKSFPWLDVIILAHSQKKYSHIESKKMILVECGSNGEYIGHLRLRKNKSGWSFENRFIPIDRSIPINQTAQKLVDNYYHNLNHD